MQAYPSLRPRRIVIVDCTTQSKRHLDDLVEYDLAVGAVVEPCDARSFAAVSCALSKVPPASVQAVIWAAPKVCIIPTDVVIARLEALRGDAFRLSPARG